MTAVSWPTGAVASPTIARIHIIGGPGSGKTTLARRLSALTGSPVHHLDDIARVGGGTGRVRTPAEREPLVAAILDAERAITEGVHLGWTEPLLARADLVIWLDLASGASAAGRIADRFAANAWAQFRGRSWRERLTAAPGYAGHARDLASAMLATRRYGRSVRPGEPVPPPVEPDGTLDSRAATEAALAAHAGRLVVLHDHAQADALLAELAAGRLSRVGPAVRS